MRPGAKRAETNTLSVVCPSVSQLGQWIATAGSTRSAFLRSANFTWLESVIEKPPPAVHCPRGPSRLQSTFRTTRGP